MNKITATHFYNYVQCPTRVYLSYYGDSSLKVKISDFMEKKIEEGLLHEKNVVKKIKIKEIKSRTIEEGYKKTLELMRNGEELIYQGVLLDRNFIGRPDLLRKKRGKSGLGNHYYEAEDIKLGHHAKEEYKMQVAFYNFLLGKIQGVIPKNGAIILWDGSTEEFEVEDEKFKEILRDVEKISKGKKKDPVLCNTCRECAWKKHCLDYLKKKDDISLVYKLSRKAKGILNENKIYSLSNLTKTKIKEMTGISTRTMQKFKLQAKALLENKDIALDKIELPKKKTEIFFDIEGDSGSGTRYLFGMWINGKYKYFLAKNPKEEEKAWKEFIEFFENQKDFAVYYYGNYEKIELKKLKEKYGCDEKTYKKLTENMVDLYKMVLRSSILPVYSYSIKSVAHYLGFNWKSEKAGGAQSMFWYGLWLETKDKKWLDLILEYNKDDCEATKIVKDWLAKK